MHGPWSFLFYSCYTTLLNRSCSSKVVFILLLNNKKQEIKLNLAGECHRPRVTTLGTLLLLLLIKGSKILNVLLDPQGLVVAVWGGEKKEGTGGILGNLKIGGGNLYSGHCVTGGKGGSVTRGMLLLPTSGNVVGTVISFLLPWTLPDISDNAMKIMAKRNIRFEAILAERVCVVFGAKGGIGNRIFCSGDKWQHIRGMLLGFYSPP